MDTPLVSMLSLCWLCTGDIQMYGGIWTPPLSDNSCFFMLCMYRGIQTSSKHMGGIQTYWGCPSIQGPSKHGCVQTYRETSKHMRVSKHTGGHPNMRGIQSYGGIPTYKGASKCMGAYGNPLSLTNHAFFVLCMYRGHPNMWGHTMFFLFCKVLNYIPHLEFVPSFLIFFFFEF